MSNHAGVDSMVAVNIRAGLAVVNSKDIVD
jgi:hypothetical protein